MNEYEHSLTQINSSIDMSKVLHTSIAYMNKKRKIQAEQLGMPLPKHLCSYQTFNECGSSSSNIATEELLAYMIMGENEGRRQDDDSEPESGKDSNSFYGDDDSVMSGDAKTDPRWLKSCSSDHHSTSSVNCGGKWSKDALYSLESRSMTKPECPDKWEQTSISPGWQRLLDYEEHLLEFENNGDCNYPDCKTEGVEPSTGKELEDLLYSNGLNPNNYVLSSGRWTVNQDSIPGEKKLTIDKEFEQYFSMLML